MNQHNWIQIDESVGANADWVKKLNLSTAAVIAVVIMGLGVLLDYFFVSIPVAVIAAVGLLRLLARRSDSILGRDLDCSRASETTHARLFNVVDGLCVASGDQRPQLRIIASDYPLAVAFIDEGESVIAVSETFMSTMDRMEIEAVMAHLLWRIRVGNVALVAGCASALSVLGMVGIGSLVKRFARRALSSEVLVWADIAACQATRFPPALISALEKCHGNSAAVSLGVTDFLCFAHPSDGQHDANTRWNIPSLGVSRSSLDERIAILKEM